MNENTIISKIKEFSSSLLEASFNEVESQEKLKKIHLYFQQVTEISGYDQKFEHLVAIPAAKGKALGLNHAAQCLLDFKRTFAFVKAIIKAIKENQKKHSGQIINIFYAGCGPYAPFISLIAPLFDPTQIQFSILEINKPSLDSAKKLIHSLGLSDYVSDYNQADAVTFKVKQPESFHILISETLDALLYRECYVPILINLLSQFDKNILVIPENVLINLSLAKHSKESTKYSESEFGCIFNVRKAISMEACEGNIPAQLSGKIIDLKQLDIESFDAFLLDTIVQIYGEIKLGRNESSLTLPLEMVLEQPFNYDSITFFYQLAPEIELKYTLK